MRLSLAAILAFAASASAYDVVSLTAENYDELTDGKTVFLKFFAPWVSPFTSSHDPLRVLAMRRSPVNALFNCTFVWKVSVDMFILECIDGKPKD
jgi:hypothetical protein